MEIERILLVIDRLISFWRDQNIKITTKTLQEIDLIQKDKVLRLPNDFKELYSKVNGMEDYYPNEIDEEGFLFYPLEALIPVSREFEDSNLINKDRILIFAEYMHKSWWYGVEVKENFEYVIGIIPDKTIFKPITNSLAEFIELYIDNSTKLYDYS